MDKSVVEYKKIVDGLINNGFGELKDKHICFVNFILYKPFAAQVLDFGLIKLVFLNPEKLKGLSKKELKGLFAHELCHFVIYSKQNFFQRLSFLLFIGVSKKMNRINEEKTDLLVVKNGYGKELLAFALGRDRRYSKKELVKIYKRGYLSPERIKFYMRKYKNDFGN